MAFPMDELLGHLGKPGRYQVLVCLLLCFNFLQVSFNHVCMAFFGAPPLKYRCGVMVDSEIMQTVNVSDDLSVCPLLAKDEWCPVRDNCSACGQDTLYVTEEREWTIVTEFGLVCDDAYLSNLATSIYFVGVMVGGVIFGHLADAVGRLPILIATMYFPVAVGVGLFFVRTYTVFVILRFVMGFLMQGLQIVTISLIIEYFSPKHRGVAACLLGVFFALGVFLLAVVALLIRDWHWIQLTISLLTLLTISYVWLFPESLRWLLSKRKYERARKLTEKIARYNGLKEVPDVVTSMLKDHSETEHKIIVYNLTHLFRSKSILLRSIVLWFMWFSVSVVYYGVILNTGTLHGFKYTNFLILACVEIAANSVAVVLINVLGRRRPLMFYFLLGGIGAIVSAVVTDRTAKTVLALIGRFGIAGAFGVNMVFTSELYPTLMRNVGLGSCTFWTRVGGLVAPLINLMGTLENVYKPTPIIIFGVLSMCASLLTLLLPETLHRKLPDTPEEAADLGWGCCVRTRTYEMTESETKGTKF